MFDKNRLNNPKFYNNTSGYMIDSPGVRDPENIMQGAIPIHFNVRNLVADADKGMQSDYLLVHPAEIYSASIFCKTSNYMLFDGTDPQVKLYVLGFDTNKLNPQILGLTSIDKADFPAQDWFRLGLENIVIPDGVQYISLRAQITRNGDVWFSCPCIEFGSEVTVFNPYNSNLGEYYNTIIYDGVKETDQLIKTQNIVFDEAGTITEKIQSRFYILTCDEEGLIYYEEGLGIIANPFVETLEFRRQRILNRFSSVLPFTFPFLQTKLDQLLGKNNWNAYLDFPNYTLYVEYIVDNQVWFNEVKVTISSIKPANIVFLGIAASKHNIGLNESVTVVPYNLNYDLDGTWSLGEKPFASFGDEELIKMSQTPSIKTDLLNKAASHSATDVVKVLLNDSVEVTAFNVREGVNNSGIIEYSVSPALGVSPITNIKLLGTADAVLTESTVYIPVTADSLIKHTINFSEVLS